MMTTSAKNTTNVTMAGNMTKKMTNMRGGKQQTRQSKTLIRFKPATPLNFFTIW